MFKTDKVSYCDSRQGKLSNCGVVAALAALSQRPEFLTNIFPKIHSTIKGETRVFKMFCEGEATAVAIDDKLPFSQLF